MVTFQGLTFHTAGRLQDMAELSYHNLNILHVANRPRIHDFFLSSIFRSVYSGNENAAGRLVLPQVTSAVLTVAASILLSL